MRDVVGQLEREVEVSGIEEVAAFTIVNDAKMFKILIDGLYSDKPRAILRELGTNAFDAHIMAGTPNRPFKLRLPSRWESSLSIRDFGPSMSHQDIMGLYSTVGRSTKDKTNTQVGKFGLGSKTPFAYTDSFTVTAWQNGERRIYNALMDKDGIPKIALFSRDPSDEESGIEISFPVQEKDIHAFNYAAQRVAIGFPVLPECNADLNTRPLQPQLSGKSWTLYKHNEWVRGPHVRQGCVLYPIDTQALQTIRRSMEIEAFSGETIIVDMPIGTVEITPSRETLSYDSTTAENVIKAFEAIFVEVKERALEEVAAATTLHDATKVFIKAFTSITNNNMRQAILRSLVWRGRQLGNYIEVTPFAAKRLVRVGKFQTVTMSYNRRRTTSLVTQADYHGSNHEPHKKIKIFTYYGDAAPRHLRARFKAEMSGGEHCYFAPNFDLSSPFGKLVWVTFGRPPAKDFEVIDISQVAPELPDATTTRELAMLRTFNGNSFGKETLRPDAEDVYYIHTKALAPLHEGKDFNSLGILWNELVQMGLIKSTATLVSLPASRKDLIKAVPPDWVEFVPEAKRIITETFDVAKASFQGAYNIYKGDSGQKDMFTLLEKVVGKGHVFDETYAFGKAIALLGNGLKRTEDGHIHLRLKELFQHVMSADEAVAAIKGYDPVTPSRHLHAAVRNVKQDYPMLEVLLRLAARHYNTVELENDLKAISDYVHLVDAKAAEEAAKAAIPLPSNVILLDVGQAA